MRFKSIPFLIIRKIFFATNRSREISLAKLTKKKHLGRNSQYFLAKSGVIFLMKCSGGSKGGPRDASSPHPPPPPRVQILSISCSFWKILAKSYVGAPPSPREVAPPLQGNPASATEIYHVLDFHKLKQIIFHVFLDQPLFIASDL